MNCTPAAPLRVLAVSEDRRLLRHLTRFLTAFGYHVSQAADAAQAIAACDAGLLHFIILDGESRSVGSEELLRTMTMRARVPQAYKFLLTERPNARTISAALEMGIDDILARPVVHGELLARLRAAARALESRKRVSELNLVDSGTGLHSRYAFHYSLSEHTKNLRRTSKPLGCAILDIDYFCRIRELYGHRASATLLDMIASHLSTAVRDDEFLAYLGEDQFGVLLSAHQESEAVAVAQRICDSLADAEFTCQGHAVQVTASAGVSCARMESAVGDVYEQALQALECAKKSGRDCVVRSGEFADETQEWNGLAQPGRLFEHTKARDVMLHGPTYLLVGDTIATAATLLGQSNAVLIPVVNAAGMLAGQVRREQLLDEDTGQTKSGLALDATVDEIMQDATSTCSEETAFSELMELLAECENVVVTDQDRPTGLVTSAGIASLSVPLRTNSFRETYGVTEGARSLRVAEEDALRQ